jgi:hypothetical protein
MFEVRMGSFYCLIFATIGVEGIIQHTIENGVNTALFMPLPHLGYRSTRKPNHLGLLVDRTGFDTCIFRLR